MSSELTPNAVELFLKNNPDFFVDRDELVSSLRIPHATGPAVSLVEKQLSVLRERNSELRNRLNGLIDNARDNDKLFTHTRRLVLSLLDAKNLAQAIDIIYASFRNDFGIETTQIILFGHDRISSARNETLENAQTHIGKYLKARQTIGGGIGPDERKFIFGAQSNEVGSAALAVLAYGDIYGVIGIGNKDPNAYNSSMGTLFLSYIAEVLSRSLRGFYQK